MARFASWFFLALCALLICAPYVITSSDAVGIVSIGAVDDDAEPNAADFNGADTDDDESFADDDDDINVAGDDDEEMEDVEEDDLDPETVADNPAIDANKPVIIDPPGQEKASYSAPDPEGAVFFEDFQSGLSKWTHTSASDYNGKFVTGQGAEPTLTGDRALIVPEKARKYGLSTSIPGLADLSGKDLVIQYELKVEQGISCGGAYLKLPLPDFEPKSLTGDTPYSIMFGPDKCGATDKVHFIFQSVNPTTGKRVEHHLKNPPNIANSYDKKTHLYTLIVKKDGTYNVLIDQEKKSYGSLAEKFDPPVQPPKQIDDPDDKKPSDWVDTKKIPDPKAEKPDDWDEDAPMQIPDEDAKKPEGWLDDEPEKVPDPQAKKPDEWDEDEDGEWEAPMTSNPKCEKAGCGEWKRPMKTNPAYKGKWTPPLIDNPKYIGEWKPRKVDNPDYYEVKSPKLLGIGGVAFEIWTMDHAVLFDNLYIGHDIEAAEKFSNATFRVKQKTELDREEKERKDRDANEKKKGKGKKKSKDANSGSLGVFMDHIEDAVDKVEKMLEPVEVLLHKAGFEPYLDKLIDLGIQKPMIVVVSVPLVIVLLMVTLLGTAKKKERVPASSSATEEERSAATEAAEKKKTDAETEDVPASEAEVNEVEAEVIEPTEGEEEVSGLRQRSVTSDE